MKFQQVMKNPEHKNSYIKKSNKNELLKNEGKPLLKSKPLHKSLMISEFHNDLESRNHY